MKISAPKTVGILLKGKMGRNPTIRMNNVPVRFVTSARYLGVTIDSNMTFTTHVKETSSKAVNLFSSISRMVKLKYGVSFKQLNFLYGTVFIPIIGYGARAWQQKTDA